MQINLDVKYKNKSATDLARLREAYNEMQKYLDFNEVNYAIDTAGMPELGIATSSHK